MIASTPTHVVALLPHGQGESSPVDPARLMAGDPAPRVWNLYTDATGQFHAGQWAAGAGRWRVTYEAHEEEHCVLLEGSVRLTDRHGVVQTFHSGDAFVVPGGFEGTWENIGAVRKHYAIMHLKEAS